MLIPFLLLVVFATTCVVAVLVLFFGGKKMRQKWKAVLAVPAGCLSVIVLGGLSLLLLLYVFGERQDQDRQTYAEIFGYMPAIGDDRMLSNKSGSGANREIFLRAEVTVNEKRRILNIDGVKTSERTMQSVIEAGTAKQFGWWLEADPFTDDHACTAGKFYSLADFNGWTELVLIECPKPADHMFMQLGHTDFVYVMARGRDN